MAVVNALLIAGALTILVWTARPREASTWEWPVVLCVLAGAYACLHFRTFYRPESTLYLFLALEMLLLERWLIDGNNRRLLWLPLLTWGIAQLHTTAVLLVLVYGAYVMHWALGAVRTPLSCAARQAALLIAVGAAMLALPIINPNGIEQVLLLVRSTGEGQHLVEYLPVWSMIYRWHFLALALVAVAAWLLSPERRNVDLALLLGFGWLAFRYNRNLGLFALMAIVPVTRTVLHYATRRSGSITLRSRRWIAAGFVIIGVAGLIAVTWRGGGWGVGIREGIFPEKAVDVIRRVSTGGNVMNFYPYGGFLA